MNWVNVHWIEHRFNTGIEPLWDHLHLLLHNTIVNLAVLLVLKMTDEDLLTGTNKRMRRTTNSARRCRKSRRFLSQHAHRDGQGATRGGDKKQGGKRIHHEVAEIARLHFARMRNAVAPAQYASKIHIPPLSEVIQSPCVVGTTMTHEH